MIFSLSYVTHILIKLFETSASQQNIRQTWYFTVYGCSSYMVQLILRLVHTVILTMLLP